MKWKQETEFRQSPFKLLTLPESHHRPSLNNGVRSETPTTMSSLGFHRPATRTRALSSATWPRPKMKRGKCKVNVSHHEDADDEDGRPKTATLERPKVLDISFLGKIDMTNLTKKSLMSIANLCILPVKQEIRRTGGYLTVGKIYRSKRGTPQHSNPSSPSPSLRKSQRSLMAKEAVSDTETCVSGNVPLKSPTKTGNHLKVRSHNAPLNREKSQDSNNNDKESSKKPVNRPKTVMPKKSKHMDEVFGGHVLVSEPCTTCGRPELPERLHSHPVPTRTLPRTPAPTSPTPSPRPPVVKSSVRKPVAIKYRSDKTKKKEETETTTTPARESNPEPEKKSMPPKTKGPRTVLCYICGRGFGTASYPLHEPQCLQRWHRENAILSPHLQRSPPRRPDLPANSEEWNNLAFQASQAQLVSCENCGRTFNPDRLEVHLRSCRPEAGKRGSALPRTPETAPSSTETDSSGASGRGPPVVYCYICGRMFGTKSISIHEPQCLEKWRAENELLRPDQRRPEPIKPDLGVTREHAAPTPSPSSPPPAAKKPTGTIFGRRGRAIPCYLCGREFFSGSIGIHEPQCLVKWRLENDKLPPERRRQEPEKPDIKYTASGAIDYQGTMDAMWESHLQQLVPCKHCGRTFNPDRVDIHERSCKGPRH